MTGLGLPRKADGAEARLGYGLLLLVLVIAALRFIDLGRQDLEKDEALWCIRAKAVAFHGEWIDTTPHSVGKLMVSSYPPLHAWMTGTLYRLFGAGAFTGRAVSASAGAATVLLICLMGSMAFGRWAGFFAALALGFNVLFFEYSRLGQLEALYLFTIVAAFWLYMLHSQRQIERIQAISENGGANIPVCAMQGKQECLPHRITLPLILCGVAFGLALLSKIATGLFVPIVLTPYLVYLVFNRRRRFGGALVELGIIVGIGVVIAAPWHVAMTMKYSAAHPFEGKTFVDWFYWHHIVERSEKPLEGLHHSGYGWGHLFYVNAIVVNMPFIAVAAVCGIGAAIKASLPWPRRRNPLCPASRGGEGQGEGPNCRRDALILPSSGGRGDEAASAGGSEFRMLFLLWAILTFAVLERSATRMSSYVITLTPPIALFAGWTLAQVARGRIGSLGRTLLLGFTILCVAYMADQDAQDALETLLGRFFHRPVDDPMTRWWVLMIGAYAGGAALLAAAYHVFLSRKARFARAAAVVLVALIVAGGAGKGTFGKLMAGPEDTDWETLRKVIPAKADYDMVLEVGHWRDDRQIQYYLDGIAAHWETRMRLELRDIPENWESLRDALVINQPYSFDGRWVVDPEAPLFKPAAWKLDDARLQNLTDETVVAILMSDDSVERKLERLLQSRRVLVLLTGDTDLAREYRDLIERNARRLGETKELGLFLSGS